jgi:hypothetical protein
VPDYWATANPVEAWMSAYGQDGHPVHEERSGLG